MRVRLLGTAAGGGLPQWNCHCQNCLRTRRGALRRRTQSCIAVSVDGRRWVLINASPDFGTQADALNSEGGAPTLRTSPVAAVIVTNADLDHVLGLANLRDNPGAAIYSTPSVRRTLEAGLRMESLLDSFGGAQWRELPEEFIPIPEAAGLELRAIPLGGAAPRYAGTATPPDDGQSVAVLIREGRRTLVAAPDVALITPALRAALEAADALLFDGTFWDDDELIRVRTGARTARQMGHLPVRESLATLGALGARWKGYIHINNTNPILDPDSTERAQVDAARVRVDEDGAEWIL